MDDLDKSIKIAEEQIKLTGKVSRKGSVDRSPIKDETTGLWHQTHQRNTKKQKLLKLQANAEEQFN